MSRDEIYMRRAFELARLGAGSVSPNPLVGCVIVVNEKIIGEGWHMKFGDPHAEVNAVATVSDRAILREATVYVNLEPCSHHGKTPPCADMLIRNEVKKVVIANADPNPLVAGAGIEKLRKAGIEVVTGVMEKEGLEFNRRFFTFIGKERPYLILKWAQTEDGFIARENYDSKWISNTESRKLVHRWRSEEDAVLVGAGTAAHDNPRLNVRDWQGRNPVRVVLDRSLRLNRELHLFDHSQPTLCYNTELDSKEENLVFVNLNADNFIGDMMTDLYRRNIQSVIIEGGAQIITAFMKLSLWDEARVFQSEEKFLKGIPAPVVMGRLVEETQIQNDVLRVYKRS